MSQTHRAKEEQLILNGIIAGSHGILNGDLAKIEDYPYLVNLEFKSGNLYPCTGVIISSHYVLTEAWCGIKADSRGGLVRAGSNWRGRGGSEHNIEKYIHPPGYYGDSRIALLRVEQPFKFDETRQPIQLFDRDEEIQAGEVGTVIGWEGDETDEVEGLRTINYTVTRQKICREAFNPATGFGADLICAGNYEFKGKDVCDGDEGAPLVIDGLLAGIILRTWYGCRGKYPPLFSNVTDLSDWVYTQVGCSPLTCRIGYEPSVHIVP